MSILVEIVKSYINICMCPAGLLSISTQTKQGCLDSPNHFPVNPHCYRILPSFSHSPPLNGSDNFLTAEMYSEGPLD